MKTIHRKKGDVIVIEGEEDNDAYIILEGEIEVTKKGRSYGIIQWIKLEMGNGLNHENPPANLTKASAWQRILYIFDDPIELSNGQKVVITAKHERNIFWFFLEKIQ